MTGENHARPWTLTALLAATAAGGVAVANLPAKEKAMHEVPAGVTVIETYQDHRRFDWRQQDDTRFRVLATTHGPATLELPQWVGVDEVTYGQEELRLEQLGATTADGDVVTTDLRLGLQASIGLAGQLDQTHPGWPGKIVTLAKATWSETISEYSGTELNDISQADIGAAIEARLTAKLAETMPGLGLENAALSNTRHKGHVLSANQEVTTELAAWRAERAASAAPSTAPTHAPRRLAIGG